VAEREQKGQGRRNGEMGLLVMNGWREGKAVTGRLAGSHDELLRVADYVHG